MNFLLLFILSAVAISMTIIPVEGTVVHGCKPPHSPCGNHCCSPGSTCLSGICCPKGYNIIGNICCAPSDSCGKVCCSGNSSAPGQHPKHNCANPKIGLCCMHGKVDKNGICCSPRSSNCNGACCGGSCVRGECREKGPGRCKVRSCSRQKDCHIGSRCVEGCCVPGI